MSEERRKNPRIRLNLPARYDGLSGVQESRLEDISFGGCFVNTHAQVTIGEVISLEIQLPSGEWLRLHGQVTMYQPSIGFGVVFSSLSEDEERTLRLLIRS